MAATLKVYGVPVSQATMRVFSVIYEKDLPYELVPVNWATGQNKSEAFLALNPFGLVPALEDGHLKLFESRAIAQYLAHQYADKGPQLIDLHDPKRMAIISVWSEVEAHHFDKPAFKLAFELGVKPLLGRTMDPGVVEEKEADLAKVLDIYEARLAQTKYLAGDSFSLADLQHQPPLHFLMPSQVKNLIESRPHVYAWCKDILARPAWTKVACLVQEALKEL